MAQGSPGGARPNYALRRALAALAVLVAVVVVASAVALASLSPGDMEDSESTAAGPPAERASVPDGDTTASADRAEAGDQARFESTADPETRTQAVDDPALAGPDLSALDLTPGAITPDPAVAPGDTPDVYARKCSTPFGSAEVIRCDAGDPDGERVVAVVGDSKVAQWADAVEEIAEREGWQLRVYVRSACPWTAATVNNEGGPDTTCLQWGRRVRDRLVGDERPDAVIVSGVKARAGVSRSDQGIDLLAQGYVDYWTELGELGVSVVALADTPQPGDADVYECVDRHRQDVSVCAFPRNDGSGTEALRRAAERVPTATMVDMNDWVCPLADCPPVVDGVLTYRRGSHITTTFALALTDPLQARLVTALGW
jgi:hypothetical protein